MTRWPMASPSARIRSCNSFGNRAKVASASSSVGCNSSSDIAVSALELRRPEGRVVIQYPTCPVSFNRLLGGTFAALQVLLGVTQVEDFRTPAKILIDPGEEFLSRLW